MTVRVVGFVGETKHGEVIGKTMTSLHDIPCVKLPAVIEALEAIAYGPYDAQGELASYIAHLKQLTTPADAGGRVK